MKIDVDVPREASTTVLRNANESLACCWDRVAKMALNSGKCVALYVDETTTVTFDPWIMLQACVTSGTRTIPVGV